MGSSDDNQVLKKPIPDDMGCHSKLAYAKSLSVITYTIQLKAGKAHGERMVCVFGLLAGCVCLCVCGCLGGGVHIF